MGNARLLSLILTPLLVFIVGCGATQPTAKSVVRDPIPDLPDYPGATRTVYSTGDDMGQGFSKTVKVESVTSEPHEKVLDFYSKALRDNGWQMGKIESSTESVAESKSKVTMIVSKGTSIAKIEINQKGKDNIVISVERKDK
jgi:hypothetical protein